MNLETADSSGLRFGADSCWCSWAGDSAVQIRMTASRLALGCRLKQFRIIGSPEDAGLLYGITLTVRRNDDLLRDRGLVAHRLPVTRAAHPASSVAVGTAQLFPKLVPFHFPPR